jgi:hypothetical protein
VDLNRPIGAVRRLAVPGTTILTRRIARGSVSFAKHLNFLAIAGKKKREIG